MKKLTIGFGKKRKEILSSFNNNDNYISLMDIINGSETSANVVYNKVYSYLDENCDNGYFSRWTSHGNSVSQDADSYVEECINKGLLF